MAIPAAPPFPAAPPGTTFVGFEADGSPIFVDMEELEEIQDLLSQDSTVAPDDMSQHHDLAPPPQEE